MIVEIEAKFACDDCGTEFVVSLDPASQAPRGWTVFEIAEEAIRGGSEYRDGFERPGAIGSVSIHGRHYCDRCTLKHDSE